MTEDEKLVKRIDEFGQGLNQWEVDFVARMVDKVAKKEPIFTKERAVLQRIDDTRVR